MAKPRLRCTLLCEDQEHERFFRRLLETKWVGRGKLRVERIPNRQGAGDAYVISRYAQEVRLARSKRFENYALVVAIDGDRVKLQERLRQLDQQLKDAHLDERGPKESIAICVPTRSIETWELWLCGDRGIDEDGVYKSRFRDASKRGEVSVKAAVAAWFRELSAEDTATEAAAVPSLTAGRSEMERLEETS